MEAEDKQNASRAMVSLQNELDSSANQSDHSHDRWRVRNAGGALIGLLRVITAASSGGVKALRIIDLALASEFGLGGLLKVLQIILTIFKFTGALNVELALDFLKLRKFHPMTVSVCRN